MLSNPVKGLGRWGVRSLCSADPAPFQGPRVASPFTYSPIPHAQRARPSGSHDVRAAFTRPYQAVARPAVLRLLTDTHKSCVFNRSCWHQNTYPAGVLVSCSLTWAGFACSMCPYCSPALNDLGPRPPPMTAYRTRDCGNCRAYTVIWGTFRKPRKRRAVSSVGLERLLTSRRSPVRVLGAPANIFSNLQDISPCADAYVSSLCQQRSRSRVATIGTR